MRKRQVIRAETKVLQTSLAEIVLGAASGTVLAVGGIEGASLRRLIDQVEVDPTSPRVLFVRIVPGKSTEAIVEQVIELFSNTVHRLWPTWFTDVSFAECRNDRLGRLAAAAIARRATVKFSGLSLTWAEAATGLALDDRPPRVRGMLPAVELAQLALAIGGYGLVLATEFEETSARSNPTAFVHALEWIAGHARCAVIALFPVLPPHEPPFDRILFGARVVTEADQDRIADVAPERTAEIWLAPWLGSPHPLSETEQRLEKALRADAELAPLFGCNQFVETARGSRPKVDFVWTKGRFVVELDGYGSHGNRAAFMYDRHRDYELTLSGYTVLRLANDEIAQDIGKAVEKIRDIVHLCRDRIM
jgi:very-short-patch-repair endonuclease